MLSSVLLVATTVNAGNLCRDLFVVLAAAYCAGVLSTRIGLPAILGEITAGVLVGPSVFGFVHPTISLSSLAEIGVIILLAEVGMEMDLAAMRKLGNTAVGVAILGVAIPMSSGFIAGRVMNESVNTSLFIGAALAATSIGITARVFGDAKLLASTEARIVLGAAVADDVLGLVILTIISRIVDRGSINAASVLSTLGIAIAFLAIAIIIAITIVPKIFSFVATSQRHHVSLGVMGLAVVFAFSAAAHAAHLAPIIGAFVGGIALGRTHHRERISRDFRAVGSIVVPIFFIQIGIDTRLSDFGNAHVIALALVLTAVAVMGKLLAGLGSIRTAGDSLLVGIGMIPRGEVGLIFAAAGVTAGVFHQDLYAVIVLVVLVTTVITPPLLRWRLSYSDSSTRSIAPTDADIAAEPVGGWIRIRDGEISLGAIPPDSLILRLALEAALHSTSSQPSKELLDWLNQHRTTPILWDSESTQLFLDVLARGTARSWKFLEATNILERALPQLAQAIERRRHDATELDPTQSLRFPTMETIRSKVARPTIEDCALLIAALLCDVSDSTIDRSLVDGLQLSPQMTTQSVSMAQASSLLLASIAFENIEPDQRTLSQLASYLADPLTVEKCRMLTEARISLEDWQYAALLNLTIGVQALLSHPELLGSNQTLVDVRRRDAMALCTHDTDVERIRAAENLFLLAHEPTTLAQYAALVREPVKKRHSRVAVSRLKEGTWEISVVAHDCRGLLARITSALATSNLNIVDATLATWPDGIALDIFIVTAENEPQHDVITEAINLTLRRGYRLGSDHDVHELHLQIDTDNNSHPWHSVVTVIGKDTKGALSAISSAFTKNRIEVHHARIATNDATITDRFEVSDRHGRKLSPQLVSRLQRALS